MGRKAQPADKRADALGAHAALEADNSEGSHHEAQKPPVLFCGGPPPRLWGAIAAFHRLCETMPPALGAPGLMGNVADALLGVVTKSVENPKTFGPQSPVGLSSEGILHSGSNTAPQSTGPTPHCPALGDFPKIVMDLKPDGSSLSPAPIRTVFGDVAHQICPFHVLKELTQGILRAVAAERRRLAHATPKLPRGRPSSKEKTARRLAHKSKQIQEKIRCVFQGRFLLVKRRLKPSERKKLLQITPG